MYPGYVSINDIGDIGDPFPCRDRIYFNKFEVNYIDSFFGMEYSSFLLWIFEF